MKHTIVFHTINLAKKMRKAMRVKLGNPSFSYSQSSALLAIDSQREINQKEIATRLHLEPASVVSLIDELEKLKLAQRRPANRDRRKYQIVLTEKGKVITGKIRSQATQLESFLVEKLGKKEAKKFFLAVEAISTYLDQYQEKITNPPKILREGGEK